MTICGMVAEWNPFHLGHRHLIQEVRRQLGDTLIVAVMSGPFTQRGDVAIVSKWARAKMALCGGCDLIFELHQGYATQSAEVFAQGAVRTLLAAGPLDNLAFGSECGNLSQLTTLKEAWCNPGAQFQQIFRQALSDGASFHVAQQLALETVTGESNLRHRPNDRLNMLYLSALPQTVTPLAIPRKHCFASASQLRKNIYAQQHIDQDLPDFSRDIIKKCMVSNQVPADLNKIFPALQVALLSQDTTSLEAQLHLEPGMARRLLAGAACAQSLDEWLRQTQTRHYTKSRLRRLLLSWLSPVDTPQEIPYLRVLGANKRGCAHLKQLSKKGVPIIQNVGRDQKHLSFESDRALAADVRRQDLQSFLMGDGSLQERGRDYKEPPVIASV